MDEQKYSKTYEENISIHEKIRKQKTKEIILNEASLSGS
jgi:hypothetical protein